MRHSSLPIATMALTVIVLTGCTSQPGSPRPSADATGAPRPAISSSPTSTHVAGTPAPTPLPSSARTAIPALWRATGRMVMAHAFHTATLLADGTVLVAGGQQNDRIDGKVVAAAERYDPGRGAWTATRPMSQPRWGHTATLLGDGRVLVAGSYRGSADPAASAELYDTTTGRWTATGAMTTGRGGHTATLLPDGRVLVVGGGAEDNQLEGGPRSATAEIYDPASGRWTRTGSMIEARKGFSATLLADGRVLVAGGDGGFASAELYDPGSGRWTATGSMIDGRFGHSATRLADGTVLVAGGCACSDPGAMSSAERYDPVSGTWTATGSMATARIFHPATLLADGQVLVVNAGLLDDEPPSAETYDPDPGIWTVGPRPARARYGATATLLADGTVLVTGDYDDQSRASAELYVPGH